MSVQTPEWVKNAIFYQILPDRFARSPRTKHPRGIEFKPWGSPPEAQGYQGGDLRGIVDRLDYLSELGITALYLNPIFASASNHRYHTFDYFQVDPLLGGNDALRELLAQAHARNIRVVLDGVFNHASRGFWAFHHILENGGNSPYLDWFTIHGWPLRPYSSDQKNPPNYDSWWNLPALPKFNTKNPGVRDYLLSVAEHWVEFGIDGWRLDVPNEIDDDSFWQEFRRVVKGTNPETYIVGELWGPSQRWLQGDQFDAVMNYGFSRAAMGFFGAKTLDTTVKLSDFVFERLTAHQFAEKIDELHALYDWEINFAQLNLLDSHDTPRALWHLGGDESALRLCTLFQMTMPGAPCIYYGDEIGLTGGREPLSRGAFPWDDQSQWNTDLRTFFKQAIALRNQYPVLRTGSFRPVYVQGDVYAFVRQLNDQLAVVAFNANKQPVTIDISMENIGADGQYFNAVWGEGSYTLNQNTLPGVLIPSRQAAVLISKK